MLEKTLIYTTAEIVVSELINLEFDRVKDDTHSYLELLVNQRNPKKP